VNWDYQRASAANAVRDLTGVRGVTNTITVEPHVSALDVKSKIEAALKRSAEVDARRIDVAVADSKVTLSGNVHSWFERDEARRAAWAAPGVNEVEDHIAVVPRSEPFVNADTEAAIDARHASNGGGALAGNDSTSTSHRRRQT
jgi:osmotically-inducible protein OsmY